MVPVWTGVDLGQRVEQPGLAVLAMVHGALGGEVWECDCPTETP